MEARGEEVVLVFWEFETNFLLITTLLWAQPDAASKISTCCSTNKVRGLSEPQILGMPVLSSLAGHGGEGRRGCAGILGV
jgi:hypothetical protein